GLLYPKHQKNKRSGERRSFFGIIEMIETSAGWTTYGTSSPPDSHEVSPRDQPANQIYSLPDHRPLTPGRRRHLSDHKTASLAARRRSGLHRLNCDRHHAHTKFLRHDRVDQYRGAVHRRP